MTETMKPQMFSWKRHTGLAVVGAAVALAAILAPEQLLATTRLSATSEVVGYATVSAADTITSRAVLADGVSKTFKSV